MDMIFSLGDKALSLALEDIKEVLYIIHNFENIEKIGKL